MNSGTSTETTPAPPGLQVWQFYVLLSMVGATVAVVLSPETHPAALVLLSAAVVAAGLSAWAVHVAVSGFFSRGQGPVRQLSDTERDGIEREKALTLRSIKELEFDRAMGKIGDADFADMSTRLRARAMSLISALERQTAADNAAAAARAARSASRARTAPEVPSPPRAGTRCGSCGAEADADARFCKHCGAPLGVHA